MSEEQNTAETAATQAQEPDGAQPRKARRSRRATAPVTAPTAAAAPAADSPATSNDPADENTAAQAAQKAASSRRTKSGGPSKPAGRSRRATSSGATADEGTGGESADGSLDVFAAFGVPREQTRHSADNENVTVDIDVPERPGDEASKQTQKPARPRAEDAVPSAGTSPADAEEESPRLPATALLFQAPDMSGPRRRGSSAQDSGLGFTTGTTGGATRAEDAEVEKRADLAKGDNDAEKRGAAAEDGAEGSQGPKRRRRRGGRGRRKTTDSAHDGGAENGSDEDGTQPDPKQSTVGGADDSESVQSASGDTKGSADTKGAADTKRSADTGKDSAGSAQDDGQGHEQEEENSSGSQSSGSSRRRRRRRGGRGGRNDNGNGNGNGNGNNGGNGGSGQQEGTSAKDEVTALKGSTRLEAKRQRRKDGRSGKRRRAVITEAEFLARRESVERKMVVRAQEGRTQIAVLEDEVLVEHYVARKSQTSMVGNVYLGRVQNVLPSMEAAFVDLGKGRNAVLYAGEVNWDAAGLEGQPRRIEEALHSGDSILVQVTKDPVGHKGARLTAQVTLAGRYLVLVPSGAMTGISRKLPDTERSRLKKLLKQIVPDDQGVIVRTAAEGASEEELRRDVERLSKQWEEIQTKKDRKSTNAPTLLKGEPELATRVVRDVFNEDFKSLVVSGVEAWRTISSYISSVAPDLNERISQWTGEEDVFAANRIDEQLAKATDRKVYLPSGGSLVIDRTEAMTVVDVNTGKFTGSGGTLEETVTKNNIEAAEEIVRQLRLRDIGGIIVIDFIDMVLEANRDLVLRRLVECLGRDRTRHQVAEVTSLGLVQMTRKRVGQGLVEAFSETCEHCHGRGLIVHSEADGHPAGSNEPGGQPEGPRAGRKRKQNKPSGAKKAPAAEAEPDDAQREQVKATLATIAAAAAHAHEDSESAGTDESSTDEAGASTAPPAEKADTQDSQDSQEKEQAQGAAGTEA